MRSIKLAAAIYSSLVDGWQHICNLITAVTSPSWARVMLVVVLLILAGCDGLGAGQTAPTATATAKSTETPTLTASPTPTVTPTEKPPDAWAQERKYRFFADDYYEVADMDINATNISIVDGNLHFTYRKKSPSNKSRSRYESAVILTTYSSYVGIYLQDNTTVTKDWVPKQLNVTTLDPNGEVYWHSHTNYSLARQFENDEITYTRYYFAYLNEAELGPAYSAYND